MQRFKIAIILALIFFVQIASSCGGAGNSNSADSNTPTTPSPDPVFLGVKDNTDEFAALVKLTIEPEDVTWKETAASGTTTSPSQKKLLAVMRFTPENAKKIVELAQKIKSGEQVSIPGESWFPTELVTQSELSGNDTITAIAYSAEDFYLPPYSAGRISHIENTDFFILELTMP